MTDLETVIRLQILQQQMSERLIARYREQAHDERERERKETRDERREAI